MISAASPAADTILVDSTVFILGLLIGSFLNVCIYRIPIGKTIVRGRSYCPSCGSLIPWYLNIPVFSWLALRGRCRRCKSRISLVYPAVELLNAVCYILILRVYGLSLGAVFFACLFSIFIIIALIDLRYQIIPASLLISVLILGIAYALLQTIYSSHPWYFGLIGLAAGYASMQAAAIVFRYNIIDGDIHLMAAAGLFAGWKLILLALLAASLSAGVCAAIRLAFKKTEPDTKIPFTPFLVFGIAVSLLFGSDIAALFS